MIHRTVIDGAKRWAEANKSDPFAFNTAISMCVSGVSTLTTPDGKPGYYDAEPGTEQRKDQKGQDYRVASFKNLARP